MNIIQKYTTANECYIVGRRINVKGLMLHSVGTPQQSAEVWQRVYNVYRPNGGSVSVHAFLDSTGAVYQCLPWDMEAWHSGNSATNKSYIGIEMAEPNCIKYVGGATFTCSNPTEAKEIVRKEYYTAVELFAYLCKMYKLDPLADGVILSHAEGYKRGVASGHADPEHLWNQLGLPYTMDTFRKAVKEAMGGVINTTVDVSSTYKTVDYSVKITAKDGLRLRKEPNTICNVLTVLDYGAEVKLTKTTADGSWGYCKYGSNSGWISLEYTSKITKPTTIQPEVKVPFLVKVSIDDLRIRTGASIYSNIVKYCPPSVYTIVEVKEGSGSTKGWGKLKSGAGWISLDFVTKI